MGKIASAGGLFGGILDQQTADRWFKNTIKGRGEYIHLEIYCSSFNKSVALLHYKKKDGIQINL